MLTQVDRAIARALDLNYEATPSTELVIPLVGITTYLAVVWVLLSLRQHCTQRDLPLVPAAFRPALRNIQRCHNVALSTFSAGCFFATLQACLSYEWVSPHSQGGLYGAVCVLAGSQDHVSASLRDALNWYHLSKYWEYLDTVWLILNGKTLTFLHVFHHAVVAFTSWTWTRSDLRLAAGGVLFNTFVHVIMYYYYFACTIPSLKQTLWFKKYLTALQILQFITSLVFAAVLVAAHTNAGQGCVGWTAFVCSTAFNVALLALFINFYHKSYNTKKTSHSQTDRKKDA